MYNRSGFESHCSYKAIQAIREGEGSKQEKRQSIAAIFGTDEEETEVAIRRIVSVLCLNEYFKHIFGKEVSEATARELRELRIDPVRYQVWRPGSKKIPFEHLVSTIDFLFNEMR